MTITLACSWYPRGEFGRMKRLLLRLQAIYDHIAITFRVGADDESQIVQWMTEHNILFDTFEGWSGRHLVLKKALETNAAFIQYADMDRIVRWVELNPDELRETAQRIQQQDMLIIGRTESAWATHPRSLFETERVFNDVFSHHFGCTMDFGAGSRGLSRRAAEFIVRHATEQQALAMDTGWAVLLQRGGFTWDYVEVDGVDWETADQYRDAAADSETQHRAAEAYDLKSENWQLRVQVAQGIIQHGLMAMKRELDTTKEK